ncbi:hypothetical protein [Clostridium estertheticum]|nr:hypothetical protein [Clostridium estertheticum]
MTIIAAIVVGGLPSIDLYLICDSNVNFLQKMLRNTSQLQVATF